MRKDPAPLLILPGFDVHQNFDNVLMNGERHGQGNGAESAIHGGVQGRGFATGRIDWHQPGSEATWYSRIEPRELGSLEAQWEVINGSTSESDQGFGGGTGSGEQPAAAGASQCQA